MKLFIKSDGFTPHHVKPRSSPASLCEAGRAERGCRNASKYLPRTLSKGRGLPQRKPRVLMVALLYSAPLTRGAGFTLIEILISIIILSISLLALAGLMATTSQNTSFGGHITEAATFAQDRLEEFRVTQWANIITGSDTRTGSTGIIYTRNWNVVQNGNIRTVTITISWNDRINHSFSLISAISQ